MLSGKLCYLRSVEVYDLEIIRDWRISEHVSSFFPGFEPISLQEQKNWIDKILSESSSYYFIICDKATSSPVGIIYLTTIDRLNQHTEFGYYLGDINYHGTGIAIEAELLLLDFAFNMQNMHKVYCESLAYNKKALTIHRKFGFTEDGVKREHIYKNGRWNDIVIMSALKKEFLEKKEGIELVMNSFSCR